ncbi:MAG: hypothetical protein MPN21_04850 [Thermoanaerobaculia bacterium]|nr:hypothetical protein [Thermoanaerobaculia bacterium]
MLSLLVLTACSTSLETPPDSAPQPAGPDESMAAGSPPPKETQPPETDNPPEEPYKNTIRWSTASEVENFGFNVYRGDTADGPFQRLNDEIIEGGYTTDEPQSYTFIDDTIDPYRSYFYYVESVSLSGIRENFTPVLQAKPKLPKNDG